MQTFKIYLAAILLLLVVTNAKARIGETPEEIAKRYGPAFPQRGFVDEGVFYDMPTSKEEVHEKNGVFVGVYYIAGRCAWIQFVKKGKSKPQFSEAEMALLMADNSGKVNPGWRAVGTIPSGEHRVLTFRTADDDREARVATADGTHYASVVVFNSAWSKEVAEDNRASAAAKQGQAVTQAKEKLAGF